MITPTAKLAQDLESEKNGQAYSYEPKKKGQPKPSLSPLLLTATPLQPYSSAKL